MQAEYLFRVVITVMKIGFVFTNYNNTSYTSEAVRSIFSNEHNDTYVVVVDNKSDSENIDSLRLLEEQFDRLEVIYNDTNLGYFGGLNVGIRYLRALEPECECMVVGNNDLVFSPDFFDALNNARRLFDKYPVISPNIVTLDGVHQNPHVITGIGKFREFIFDLYYSYYFLAILIKKLAELSGSFTDRKDEEQHDVAQEIYQGYGACYILGPVFFQYFEELYAPTFLMYEEYFLSLQLEEKGYRVYYEPSIKVLHHCHAATDKLPGKFKWKLGKDAHKEYRKYIKVWR